mmetsp:Transcript_10669/g.23205  ORF Transcript_10669/g.23205 Transcript_10669/m.23205 type:complete len:300 (+) Transcript_10669:45-944(+)
MGPRLPRRGPARRLRGGARRYQPRHPARGRRHQGARGGVAAVHRRRVGRSRRRRHRHRRAAHQIRQSRDRHGRRLLRPSPRKGAFGRALPLRRATGGALAHRHQGVRADAKRAVSRKGGRGEVCLRLQGLRGVQHLRRGRTRRRLPQRGGAQAGRRARRGRQERAQRPLHPPPHPRGDPHPHPNPGGGRLLGTSGCARARRGAGHHDDALSRRLLRPPLRRLRRARDAPPLAEQAARRLLPAPPRLRRRVGHLGVRRGQLTARRARRHGLEPRDPRGACVCLLRGDAIQRRRPLRRGRR